MLLCTPLFAQFAKSLKLGEGPWFFDTGSPVTRIKVSVLVRGMAHPWGMAFLPSGNILVAERAGAFRIIRDGVLDPEPVAGAPAVAEAASGGLMDVVLHPQFNSNRWVYFTYVKAGPIPPGASYNATTVMARGRLNEQETALTEVRDLFIAEAWGTAPGGHGSRLRFAPDGTVFMSSPFRRDFENPQNPMSHISKLLRLKDDGSVPADNPFVGTEGYLPEIWSLGHRAIEGLVFHPQSGELWASEHGPQGGDEINIIARGANYGWPLVSYGRDYDGSRVSAVPWQEGMQQPELFWVPSIATTGMMFYTGDRFRQWQNDLFVGSLMTGRIPGSGHIERIEFNEYGEQKRERLLLELHQRVRDVQQGPDGLIYVLTEEADGALLVIEPAA
ncbi:MAG: PQQ-dependent sugar dehydrogenase [Pseudomonadales bacterium]|nr:PQQ-dependent sugar dehydrogenase [Pseudomonadales bacterium]